jgi:NitT/TauT family transport system permease protein
VQAADRLVAGRPRQLRVLRAELVNAAFPVTALVVLLVTWEALVGLLNVPRFLVAPPSAIWAALVDNFGYVLEHTLDTAGTAAAGFLLALVAASSIAVVIAYSRTLEQAIYPYLVITQVVPMIAVAPILAIWLGYGPLPRVIISFLIAFFPIVTNLVIGLRSPDRNMVMLMRSMNARESAVLGKVRLPWALPYLFAACRVAAPTTIIGAIVAEFVGSDRGLGYVILYAKGYQQTDMIFVAILASSILGIAFFTAVVLVESRLIGWHESRD